MSLPLLVRRLEHLAETLTEEHSPHAVDIASAAEYLRRFDRIDRSIGGTTRLRRFARITAARPMPETAKYLEQILAAMERP